MGNKSPAFQFYPKDWLTDEKVLAMSLEQQGIYFRLICIDWLNDGLSPEVFSKLNDGSDLVRSCFTNHPTKDQYLANPRLILEREKQKEWAKKSSAAGKISGKIRKLKALQNERALINGSTKLEPNTNSSSTSTSTSTSNRFTKVNLSTTVNFPSNLDNPESKAAWESWLEHKRTKNQKYKSTKTQEQALANWRNATPEEFISAVNFSIGNNYSGIFAAPNRNHVQQKKSPAQKTFETAQELLKKALFEESLLENQQNEKI